VQRGYTREGFQTRIGPSLEKPGNAMQRIRVLVGLALRKQHRFADGGVKRGTLVIGGIRLHTFGQNEIGTFR
jgi:hypothetical protein